jgi:hypothetical protein
MNAEHKRLDAQRKRRENWRLWGPYLAERAWGTVREDYSPDGAVWEYFGHDQACSRTYRWNEDGLGGISDEKQRLCFALSLWNGCDPILKERAFGLTGNQGNHGEDVKEYYFYLDATPSHSYLHYLYKYPQREYPYALLVEENRRRTRRDPTFNLRDTGVFADDKYWDVHVVYAKSDPAGIWIRITAHNRGPEVATLHVLPTLWFRNTWAWGEEAPEPRLFAAEPPPGAAWSVWAEHPDLGIYHLYGSQPSQLLFTENESNLERLWGVPNPGPFVKDAFHRYVVNDEETAVNPNKTGTKCAAWYKADVDSKCSANIDLVLRSHGPKEHYKGVLFPSPRDVFMGFEEVLQCRQSEADEFYDEILPGASEEDAAIFRQSLSGLIWSKQFYYYDVARWLDGDTILPSEKLRWGRNHRWRHLKAADLIS